MHDGVNILNAIELYMLKNGQNGKCLCSIYFTTIRESGMALPGLDAATKEG